MDKPGKMSKEELENFLSAEVASAITYLDSNISNRREQIIRYLQLDMWDLPSMRGHSAVVDGTVGNQISLMMPGLMRLMTSGPYIGSYSPAGADDEEFADLATEYVNNVVLRKDNRAESIIYDWGMDGLTQILGVVKGYWQEDIEETKQSFEGLTDDELARAFMQVQADPEQEITAHTMDDALTHSITITKTVNSSKVVVDNIPPEEFIVSANARNMQDAVLRSHRSYKRAGDLRERFGAKVDELPSYDPLYLTQERMNRGQVWQGARDIDDDTEMREIAVHEGIIRCAYDGKGIKEWYFVAAGNNDVVEILEVEEYDDQIQFYTFCPQPLPHTILGRCPGDDLVQMQRIKTSIVRQTIDNLNQANAPQRLVFSDGLAKGGLEALINRIPGGIVLGKKLPTGVPPVQELATPFFAQHSLPMLTYFDEEAEKRTGVSRASMGLDPDAINNQTATGAAIAQSAAMGKIEMIGKIWAVGGMRDMFTGILRILKKYQDFPRQVKIRGQMTTVDPRQWGNFKDWDVNVNTGLGTGSQQKDQATLMAIIGKQEMILQTLGPNNPLVSLGQYAHALRQFIGASGINDRDEYFNDVPRDFKVPPPPPQQDPKMMEVQAKTQQAMAEFKLKTQQSQVEAQRKNAEAQMNAQFKAQEAQFNADLARAIATQKADLEERKERAKTEQEVIKMERESALAIERMEREFALKWDELEKEAALELIAIRAKSASGQGIIPNG